MVWMFRTNCYRLFSSSFAATFMMWLKIYPKQNYISSPSLNRYIGLRRLILKAQTLTIFVKEASFSISITRLPLITTTAVMITLSLKLVPKSWTIYIPLCGIVQRILSDSWLNKTVEFVLNKQIFSPSHSLSLYSTTCIEWRNVNRQSGTVYNIEASIRLWKAMVIFVDREYMAGGHS